MAQLQSSAVTGSLVVTGTITAQEFNTEYVSSSILFDSGSTAFGNSSDDVHNMTGSLIVNRTPAASQGNVMIIENKADLGSSQDLIIKNTFDRDVGIRFQTGGGDYYQWLDSNGDDALIFSAAGTNRTNDATLILQQNHSVSIPNGSLSVNGTVTATSFSGTVSLDFNDLNAKTSGTGEYSTSGYLTAGRGNGGVSLTHNDGYGNANVTFNHKSGTPEQNGNSGRIEVNTDSTSSPTMDFELKANVTSGVAVQTDSILRLSDSGIIAYKELYIPQYIYHDGNTDTRIRFQANDINMQVNQSNVFRINGNDTQKEIVINEVGADYDFRVEGDTEANLLMVDAANDRVGINSSAPEAKLHINNAESWSAQDLGSSSSGSVAFRLTGRNGATNDLIMSSNGTTNYTVQVVGDAATSGQLHLNPFGGNVGVGTSSPTATLHIADAANSGVTSLSANDRIKLSGDGVLTWGASAAHGTLTWDTSKAIVSAQGSNRLHLATAGNADALVVNGANVGIGITATSDGDLGMNDPQLHVNGPATSGYHLVSRFQAGSDANDTGAAIAINHSNDRGLLIKAGRKDSDRPAAYFDLIDSNGSTTNLLTLGEYGSEFYSIFNGGNVGIGTASPNTLLHIYDGAASNTATTDLLKLEAYTGDFGATPAAIALAFKFQDSNNLTNEARIRMATVNDTDYGDNDEAASNLIFSTTNDGTESDKMIITGRGEVGIGTTNPSDLLHLAGTTAQLFIENTASDGQAYIRFKARSDRDAGPFIKATARGATATDSDLRFGDETGDTMTLNGGLVGIGTVSPAYKLSVNSGTTNVVASFKSSDNQAWIAVEDDASGTYGALIGTDSDAGHDIVLAQSSAYKRLVISSAGNVGIWPSATTSAQSPATNAALHVSGSNDVLLVEGSGSTILDVQGSQGQLFSVTDDLTGTLFAASDISGVPVFLVSGSGVSYFDGDVGIGTSNPSDNLHVKNGGSGDASIRLETTTGGDPTVYFNSAAANRSGLIRFQDNGTNIGRIEYVHNGDKLQFQAGSATGQTLELTNSASSFTGGVTITSGTSIGLTINHDTFEQGLVLHRNHASNAPSILFKNNSGTIGTFLAIDSDNQPYWQEGTGTDSYKIWHENNDGPGSGLNADTVDGIQSSRIIYGSNDSGTGEGTFTDWNSVDKSGFYSDDDATNRWSTSNWSSIIHHKLYDNNNNYASQIGFDTYDAEMYYRMNNAGTWTSWQRIFMDDYHPNADKWTTARTITLAGDLTGNVSIDGSSNVTLTAAVANNSHTHDDRYYTETEIDSQNTTLNETLAHLRGWVPGYGQSADTTVRWNRTEDALELQSDSDTSIGAVYQARRIEAGETVRFTIMVKGSAASTSGLYLRLYQHDGDMPDGKTHVSNNATGTYVQEDDRGDVAWYENSAITTGWVTFEREYTAPVDGYVSLVVLNWTNIGTNSVYLKTPDIQTTQAANSNKLDGLDSSQFLRSDASDTMNGVLTLNDTSDAQLQLTSPSTWTGIGFNDSATTSAQYIWHNGTNGTFAIGGGGSNVSGKKLHIHGGTSIGATIAGNSVPSNGLVVEGNAGIGNLTATNAVLTVKNTLSMGIPGNGTNANGRFLSIEGNTDASGEGSGRIFFTEHNSSTAAMDAYGMSIGYRGGATTVTGASGNDWTGLSSISNGQWGMWGHDNSADGALIMYGDRAATYVDFAGNNIQGVADIYVDDQIISTGDTDTYFQFHATDQARIVCAGAEVMEWGGNYAKLNDNDTLRLGAGSDFRMWHDGTNHYFRNYHHAGGNMYWQGEDTGGTNRALLYMYTNSASPYVVLFYGGNTRAATSSAGFDITGTLTATADVVAYSDERIKENIKTIDNALDKVKALRGVSYNRTDLEDKSTKVGVIAQEVQKVLPEVVQEKEDGMLSVSYGNMVSVLIEGMKEQQEQIEALKARIDELENK